MNAEKRPQLKISVAQMVKEAKARIIELETDELMNTYKDDNIVVIDIRDVRERARSGFIPGSIHMPRGMLEFWVDPESPYFRPVFAENKQFVLHCAGGWRSALAAATLQDMGLNVAHLKDGFGDWEKKGGEIEFPQPKN